MSARGLRWLAAVFLLAAGGIELYVLWQVPEALFRRREYVQGPVDLEDRRPVIEKVRYGAEQGLQVGQRVVSVNGGPLRGDQDYSLALVRSHAGDLLRLGIEGRGEIAVPLRLPSKPAQGVDVTFLLLGVLLPTFSLVLAAVVLFLKPQERVSWMYALLLLGFTSIIVGNPATELPTPLRLIATVSQSLLRYSWPAWLYLFSVYFPERLPYDVRRPWVKWMLIVPVFAVAILQAMERFGLRESFRLAQAMGDFSHRASAPTFLLVTMDITAFFWVLAWRRKNTVKPDSRRRLRLLIAGCAAGLIPLFVHDVLRSVLARGIPQASMADPWWLQMMALVALPILPLTLAYLVLVHRALDLGVAIRQGLQYALARRGVVILQGMAAMGAIWAAVLMTRQGSVPQRLQATVIAVVLVLGVRRAAERLRTWIDRQFFREAYQAEHVLTELSETVRGMVETRPLLETVTRRIAETLHVPRIAVLLGDGGQGFAPAYAVGYDAPPAVQFARDAVTVRELARASAPVRVYFDDPSSWVNRSTGPSAEEREKLVRLESQVLLPLSVRDRLLGFLSLGPKRSEEPYSGTDLRLLSSVAGQAGLALENSRLAASIAQETATRERIHREFEIARDVQRRFFPQRRPEIAGLDYAGLCRPAQSVGGDFYDFRALEDGRLAVAIGDVAGKGAPAALVMASMQASLRAQVIRNATRDLAVLVEDLNALIGEITPASRFSTLFYAQYDPGSRELSYVNAGHNPPLLLRGGEAIPLERSGPAIGLSRRLRYRQHRLTLQEGDLLVLFTDGVTEAMNEAREEFGEERLMEVLRAAVARSACTVLDDVLGAVDRFAAGAAQHDDITVVVLRVAG